MRENGIWGLNKAQHCSTARTQVVWLGADDLGADRGADAFSLSVTWHISPLSTPNAYRTKSSTIIHTSLPLHQHPLLYHMAQQQQQQQQHDTSNNNVNDNDKRPQQY